MGIGHYIRVFSCSGKAGSPLGGLGHLPRISGRPELSNWLREVSQDGMTDLRFVYVHIQRESGLGPVTL
jgi:hypothetical protein